MSLLAELESLDLSGIVNARGSIRVAIQAPGLQAVLSGGVAQTALAGLGGSMTQIRAGFSEPAALFRPLVEAAAAQLEHLGVDGVPLARYVDSVNDGAGLIAGLVRGLSIDPAALGQLLGVNLAQATGATRQGAGQFVSVALDELGDFRALVETVERGLPTDAHAYTDLALQVLLPFPRDSLAALRTGAEQILSGMGGIALPDTRTRGLVLAYDTLATAAASGNPQTLQHALDELERVRAATLASLGADLIALGNQIDRLHLDRLLAPMVHASAALRSAEQSVLDILADFRALLAQGRHLVEGFDPATLTPYLMRLMDTVEATARREVSARVDALVHRLEDWLRALLSHLPLADLRNEVTAFFHNAAQAIADAHLERAADAVRQALQQVEAALDVTQLTAEVRAALTTARDAIMGALGPVLGALQTISAEVNALAASAQAVLQRVADALAAFKQAMDGITAAVNNLGIDQAAQQVVHTLTELRHKAEQLLSIAPLPEPMRPLVQQLIDALDSVDLDAVFQPVRDAVAQFHVRDEDKQAITQALEAARHTIEHLIPAELTTSIEAEVNNALQVIQGFDPAALTVGVKQYIDEAARFLEGLDPRPHVAELRAPFQAVLQAIDAVEPHRVLQPVIQAYDAVLGAIPMPDPQTAIPAATRAAAAAGTRVAQASAAPMQRLAPAGELEVPADPAAPPATGAPPNAATSGARPGDIIRLFGYLPAQLRTALSALDHGPAGEVMRTIDGSCRGLAAQLRALRAAILQLEERIHGQLDTLLVPVAAAQLRAQLALQTHASVQAYGAVRVDASLTIVARSSPAALRTALIQTADPALQRARAAAASAGGQIGASLERAALALEQCALARVSGDLDAFLAALDPEPIAAEFDALIGAVLRQAPALLTQVRADVEAAFQRLRALLQEFNPGVQAQKFLVVLNVLREQLELLDPRRLADELGEVHAALRQAVAAYDPALLAQEIAATLTRIATQLRALDPAALLGDLNFLDDIAAQVRAASPAQALAGVGSSLTTVGQQLTAADPGALLDALGQLGPRVVDQFEQGAEAIKQEIVALLEAIRYANANASASVSVQAGVG